MAGSSSGDADGVTLYVDSREHAVIRALEDAGTPFVRRELKVGDFELASKDATYLFERKTKADWVGSTLNGRLKEQRVRMLDFASRSKTSTRLFYIFETDQPPPSYQCTARIGAVKQCKGMSERALAGSLARCLLRDGVPVLWSRNPAETVTLLAVAAHALHTTPPTPLMAAAAGGRVGSLADAADAADGADGADAADAAGGAAACNGPRSILAKRPRDARSEHRSAFLQALQGIEGVSSAVADAIHGGFPTAGALTQASLADIAGLPFTAKRRVGQAVAQRVKAAFG
jgi:ERCC4-type nuclease